MAPEGGAGAEAAVRVEAGAEAEAGVDRGAGVGGGTLLEAMVRAALALAPAREEVEDEGTRARLETMVRAALIIGVRVEGEDGAVVERRPGEEVDVQAGIRAGIAVGVDLEAIVRAALLLAQSGYGAAWAGPVAGGVRVMQEGIVVRLRAGSGARLQAMVRAAVVLGVGPRGDERNNGPAMLEAMTRAASRVPMMEVRRANAESAPLRDPLFMELLMECRTSAPGARINAKLRTALEQLPFAVRKEIASREKDRCTPLFIACKRGNVEIVEYLIVVCGVDVEQRGLYEVTDDRSVHYVTPLWCAAVSGKIGVIRCLVKNGANVNAESDSGSTPVRSACFMTHLDIVRYLVKNGADIRKPNFNGGTCLINSVQSVILCKFLLENGASVNATDIQNKTALHYAIQEHRKETTNLLLDFGADPHALSKSGDDALQTACLKGASQIFSHIVHRIQYTDERLADAHELLGSTMLDDFNDSIFAMEHWRIANNIRHRGNSYLVKRPVLPPRPAYNNAVEFISETDLDTISTDLDAMRTQSLLVCERILGVSHKDTVFRLMFRGAAYADALRYQKCIDLWMWALQIRIEKDSILYTETCYTAQALVKMMIDLNVSQLSALSDYRDNTALPRFCDVVQVLTTLTYNIKDVRSKLDIRPCSKKQSEMFDKILKCITHLVYLLIQTAITPEQNDEVFELVSKIVKLNIRSTKNDTLLHLSVSTLNVIKSTYFQEDVAIRKIFPDYNTVKMLLDCGSYINDKNESKSTPLHVACIPYNYSDQLTHLLLTYGAHVDQPNKFGDSPAFLISTNMPTDVHLLKYVSLKCLASQTIIANRIPYDNGSIPATLVKFVKFHEA